MKIGCAFDNNFLKLFKKKFSSEIKKKKILILDEIFLRSSTTVKLKSDFGR